MNDREQKIAYIKRRMEELGYNPRSLSMKATGKPDTIRNLFRGQSKNWRQDNYEAVMRVLGEEDKSQYTADDDLMMSAAHAIMSAAKARSVKLDLEQAMRLTVELYNHLMKYRKQGEKIVPNVAIAALFLDK